jgi:hypothetical protein
MAADPQPWLFAKCKCPGGIFRSNLSDRDSPTFRSIDDIYFESLLYLLSFFMSSSNITANKYYFSIHPRDKQTTADRLANSAKSLMYNVDFHTCGPVVSIKYYITFLM